MEAIYELAKEYVDQIECFPTTNNITRPHFHSSIEIIYVVSGDICITINGHSMILTEGCVSVADSYDIHAYHTEKESETIVLIIPVELIGSFTKMMRNKSFKNFYLEKSPQSWDIAYAIQKILHAGDEEDPHIKKGYAYAIMGLLSDGIGLVEKTKSSSIDLARKILIFLQENYTENISIESLSKEMGYHKDYLSRFFNSYLGCGFNSYINTLRTRHAAQLLTESNLELTDIAYKCGFGNYRTFNRCFKDIYRTAPNSYRKSIQNDIETEGK